MGLGGFFKKIAGPALGLGAGILTGNPAIGLGVAGAVSGAFKQGEANDIQREGLDITRQDIADRKPLRDAFSQRALQPIASAPNLSSAFSATGSNPFSPLGQGGEPVSLANLIPPDQGFAPQVGAEGPPPDPNDPNFFRSLPRGSPERIALRKERQANEPQKGIGGIVQRSQRRAARKKGRA